MILHQRTIGQLIFGKKLFWWGEVSWGWCWKGVLTYPKRLEGNITWPTNILQRRQISFPNPNLRLSQPCAMEVELKAHCQMLNDLRIAFIPVNDSDEPSQIWQSLGSHPGLPLLDFMSSLYLTMSVSAEGVRILYWIAYIVWISPCPQPRSVMECWRSSNYHVQVQVTLPIGSFDLWDPTPTSIDSMGMTFIQHVMRRSFYVRIIRGPSVVVSEWNHVAGIRFQANVLTLSLKRMSKFTAG